MMFVVSKNNLKRGIFELKCKKTFTPFLSTDLIHNSELEFLK